MSGPEFHVACNVGRLVEIRPEHLSSVEEVSALGKAVAAAARQAGSEFIVCADWRRLRVLSPDVADALTGLLKGRNRSLRSAALIGDHPIIGLQVERLLRVSDHPQRRAFRDAKDLLAWLGAVATAAECEQARIFLGA